MKHVEIKELLPLYIDGGLDRDESAMLEIHLAQCEDCRKELDIYKANFVFLEESAELEVPEKFMASLMERIAEEREVLAAEVATNHLHGNAWENAWDYRRGNTRETRAERSATESIMDKVRNLFKWRMQIPLGALSVVAVALLVIVAMNPLKGFHFANQGGEKSPDSGLHRELLYGGTASDGSASDTGQLEQVTPESNSRIKFSQSQSAGDSAPAPSPKMAQDNAGVTTDTYNAAGMTAGGAGKVQMERKIIQTADVTIEVKDIKASADQMLKLMDKYKGFIANSSSWVDVNNQRFNSFQLRVPVANFYAALTRLEDLGEIKQRSMNGQDVTEEYIDVESRLKNLKLQEERYRAILGKASKVEDVLQVERELERVRGEIESLQNRLNYLSNQVSLSTINVQISEPKPITSANVGVLRAIRESLRAMVNSLYYIIVLTGSYLPYVLLLVIAYVLFRVVRRRRKQ